MQEFRSGLFQYPSSTCLLTELLEQLSPLDDSSLANSLVILPTQRLATCLLAMLGQEKHNNNHPAFRPPQIKTLENFVNEQTASFPDLMEPSSRLTQELVLSALIKEGCYQHIRNGHEHEINQFFNELIETDIKQAGFSKLKKSIEDNYFHSDDHIKSLLDRFDEMEDLYLKFFQTLAGKNTSNSSAAMAAKSLALTDSLTEKDTLPWTKVFMGCFTTIKPFLQPLVAQLASKNNVAILMSESPQLFGAIRPLSELAKAITPQDASSEQGEKTKPIQRSDQQVRVHQCSNILIETAEAISLAEQYIAEGYQPSEIAILLTNENLHGKTIRSFIGQNQIQKQSEANIAITLPMSQTSFGSWLSLLQELCLSEEDAGAILDFCSHPLSLNWLAEQLKEHKPEQKIDAYQLKFILSDAICQQKCLRGFKDIADAIEHPAAKLGLQLVQNSLKSLNAQINKSKLTDWSQRLSQIFEDYQILEQENRPDQELDRGLLSSMVIASTDFFSELTKIEGIVDPQLSAKEFWKLCSEKYLALDVRAVGYPLKGLQVLSLIESRYVPFKVAIVLGCTEGNFPKALPSDHLVDDWLKSKIGLPGWQYVEALEDTTFHLLLDRLENIELFYSKDEKGDPTVRSRYIESLISQNLAQVHNHDHDHALLTKINRQSASSTEQQQLKELTDAFNIGAYAGPRESLFQSTSATALKKLITCPYHYLLSKMKISPLELPTESLAMIEGEWLHKILECFYTGYADPLKNPENSDLKTSIDIDSHRDNLYQYSLQRLEQLSYEVFPANEQQTPVHHHLLRYSWPKFVSHFCNIVQASSFKHSPTTYKEFSLGIGKNANPVSISIGQQQVFINGSIDSIDSFKEGYILTDYKRRGVDKPTDVQSGIVPQLVLYAKAMSQLKDQSSALPLQNCLIGYWSILDGEWTAQGVSEDIREWASQIGLANKNTPSVESLWETLEGLWKWRMDDLLTHHKNFNPDQSPKQWCLYCSYKNICRLGDPHYCKEVEAQASLEGLIQTKKANKKTSKKKTSASIKEKTKE